MIAMPAPRSDMIALTPSGRRELEDELRLLHSERLPELRAQLADVIEDSATRFEDAGLLELQEEQLRAERRANALERLLATACEIVAPGDGVVALGSHVGIEDGGEREAYVLVDPHEANIVAGRVSIVSPVGQALLGHRVGDEVIVRLPAGERHLRIVSSA